MVVSFNSGEDLARSLPAISGQLRDDDELIVVDNASADGSADVAASATPAVKLIRNRENEGFAAACNRGADAASGDLLLLLNPDTEPRPGFRDAIVRPLSEQPAWAAWMGLLTRAGGELINSRGNVVHFAGFTWAGGDGRPVSAAPTGPAPVPSLSGACLAIPLARWRALEGFPADFFAYLEDTDLSLRARLEGGTLGIEPRALIDHRYEFSKPGSLKWRFLERNRWAMIIRTYPATVLALVLPALLLTELALIPVSIAGRWGTAKLRANLEVVRRLPRLLRERRRIQAARTIGGRRFADGLTADLGSEYLGRAGRIAPLRWGLRAYWGVVLALLGAGSRRSSAALPPPSGEVLPRSAADPSRERSS